MLRSVSAGSAREGTLSITNGSQSIMKARVWEVFSPFSAGYRTNFSAEPFGRHVGNVLDYDSHLSLTDNGCPSISSLCQIAYTLHHWANSYSNYLQIVQTATSVSRGCYCSLMLAIPVKEKRSGGLRSDA